MTDPDTNMNLIPPEDPLGELICEAIQKGDLAKLDQLLAEHPQLAGSFLHSPDDDVRMSLMHVATDWPGHFANVGETIRRLAAAGAPVSEPMHNGHGETPLHYAASSNDVVAINALLDVGADMNAQGAVIAGGDPLEDAIGFQNWDAARCLVERGATTVLGDEAALGMMDRIEARFQSDSIPSAESIQYSFWNACCAGELTAARYLHGKGANVNWIPSWCSVTPMDGALKSENQSLIQWLTELGAQKHNVIAGESSQEDEESTSADSD